MPEEPALKRRRVLQACDRCRAMKSKCDGRHPSCSRCEGYGYPCSWGDHQWRGGSGAPGNSRTTAALQNSLRAYDKLLAQLQPGLTESDRVKVDAEMARARSSLPSDFFGVAPVVGDEQSSTNRSNDSSEVPGTPKQRYLGKASDLSYFNELKMRLTQDGGLSSPELGPDSYDNDEAEPGNAVQWSESMLPNRQRVSQLMDVYFNTIHLAYPHISRPQFLAEYERFWDQSPESHRPTEAWYATFMTILAIGAYYSSLCPQKYPWLQADLHARLFARAAVSARSIETESSLDRVQVLLSQSFYMLATCQSDRCWLILGSAIRIAQGFGLHVSDAQDRQEETKRVADLEKRRRIWYSLFILDRLLSLQLGRPLAIDAADCSVLEPSVCEDDQVQVTRDLAPAPSISPQIVDYIHVLIQFSGIIERVVRQLYGAHATRSTSAKLDTISSLDAELTQWRSQLPRALRFDLGHTFEKNAVFKRQRNMLAIKFHHLRALIHRPFLGYLTLHGVAEQPLTSASDMDWHRMKASETICMSEAQNTAHLLHNLPDEESLVHNFPWWQMISCLSCACSILLVAQKVVDSTCLADQTSADMLAADATTCISVLEVLSTNSKPARLAMKMMKHLQGCIQGPPLAAPRHNDSGPTLPGLTGPMESRPEAVSTSMAGLDPQHYPLLLDSTMDSSFSPAFDPALWTPMPFNTTDVFPWSQNLLYLTNEPPAVIRAESVAPSWSGTQDLK